MRKRSLPKIMYVKVEAEDGQNYFVVSGDVMDLARKGNIETIGIYKLESVKKLVCKGELV